jgi:uracil phosphoribosyltransferase
MTARRRSTELEREIARRSNAMSLSLGRDVREGRIRRSMTERVAASKVGISQTAWSRIEAGLGRRVPLQTWIALGIALERPLAVCFSRPLDAPRGAAHAGHLDIQEHVLGLARATSSEQAGQSSTTRPPPPHRRCGVPRLVATMGRGTHPSRGSTKGPRPRLVRPRHDPPDRAPARYDAGVTDPTTFHVSQHPAVLHKLAVLRDEDTEPKKFREVVRELSWLLGYEALQDAKTRPLQIRTPMEEMEASELGERIGLIPILRAGLGMVDAMLELMPTAQVWHLGLFRDERTLRPVEYYNKLPDSASVDLCLILDPMLATGGSATAAIDVLKRWGAVKPVRIKLINLIAAPEGVAAVQAAHPDVEIHCAALDRGLNEKGYIMPGLGDAGDRQFGTGNTD